MGCTDSGDFGTFGVPVLSYSTVPPTCVRVPASVSNLGAGFDCLGLALDIRLEARVVPGSGPAVYTGTLSELQQESDLILKAMGTAMVDGHHLEVHSEIPLSRGLGSSASATVAGLALAQAMTGQSIDNESLFGHARDIEGHPDNVGPVIYGNLFLATERPTKLQLHHSLAVALAIPEQRLDTAHARSILPERLTRADTIAQAAAAAALVLGLTTGDGDLIGHGMIDRIAVPLRKQLIPGLESAVEAATRMGAYGATISGSGSTVVAVCAVASAQDVATAMAETLTNKGNHATPMAPAVAQKGFEVF